MKSLKDNPAERLRMILLALQFTYPKREQKAAISSWSATAQILGTLNSPADTLSAVTRVALLPLNVMEAVQSTKGREKEQQDLLTHIADLQSAAVSLVRNETLADFFHHFAPDGKVQESGAFHSLAVASELLHTRMPIYQITSDDRQYIEEATQRLASRIENSTLSVEILLPISKHLRSILRAIQTVRVSGRSAIEEALDALGGFMHRHPQALNQMENGGVWEELQTWACEVGGVIFSDTSDLESTYTLTRSEYPNGPFPHETSTN